MKCILEHNIILFISVSHLTRVIETFFFFKGFYDSDLTSNIFPYRAIRQHQNRKILSFRLQNMAVISDFMLALIIGCLSQPSTS